jgi:hypothetical protein
MNHRFKHLFQSSVCSLSNRGEARNFRFLVDFGDLQGRTFCMFAFARALMLFPAVFRGVWATCKNGADE